MGNTYAMLCLCVLRILLILSNRSVNGFAVSTSLVTCVTIKHVVLSYRINSLASTTYASSLSKVSIPRAFGIKKYIICVHALYRL